MQLDEKTNKKVRKSFYTIFFDNFRRESNSLPEIRNELRTLLNTPFILLITRLRIFSSTG
jgi:hypothetical protein